MATSLPASLVALLHTLIVVATGGVSWVLAIEGGFLGGALVRVAFSIICQRTGE
ncbi:MAG: hypothetical protein ABGW81_03335 [Paracoccaceae bacterium]